MKKVLKKNEYPEYIACLAQGCPSCPLCPGKYTDCERFPWKQENMKKFGLEVNDGRITKVWEE